MTRLRAVRGKIAAAGALLFALAACAAPDRVQRTAPSSRPAFAGVPEPDSPRLAEIVAELRSMAREDQELRARLTALPDGPLGKEATDLLVALAEADARHTARLRSIVDEIGWPRAELVGREAARDAWLLAQHADQDPELQARVLELILVSPEDAGVDPQHVALLADRVQVARGLPQRYGTQYTLRRAGERTVLEPSTPIEDPARLDERRRAMGLEPHERYLARLREIYGLQHD
jgi:hypothetical protein